MSIKRDFERAGYDIGAVEDAVENISVTISWSVANFFIWLGLFIAFVVMWGWLGVAGWCGLYALKILVKQAFRKRKKKIKVLIPEDSKGNW